MLFAQPLLQLLFISTLLTPITAPASADHGSAAPLTAALSPAVSARAQEHAAVGAVTVWCGPVSKEQAGDLHWPNTRNVYIPCTGTGHPSCAEIAATKQLDQFTGDASEVYLAAFSAGGQIVKRWLPHAKVRGVYLADGTYTHWTASGRPAVDRSLVDWIVKAAHDPSFHAVFTASAWPNSDLPSGAQTLEAIAIAAGERGVGWEVHPAAGVERVDGRMWSAGGVHLLDLGKSVAHPEHATRVAPLLWPRLFARTMPLGTSSGAAGAGESAGGPVALR